MSDICNCDQSYMCSYHQSLIDRELEKTTNQERADRVDERIKWIITSLKKIADKLDINLPEEP